MRRIIIIFILFIFLQPILNAQYGAQLQRHFLTMGSDTSELYLITHWYPSGYDSCYLGIFHSNDNGKNFSLKRNKYIPYYLGETYTLFGDSSAGIVYQMLDGDTIGASIDFGSSFTATYFPFAMEPATGCVSGEFYLQSTYLLQNFLNRSIDTARTFTAVPIPDSISIADVGALPGELYFFGFGNASDGMIKIVSTTDYGATFTDHLISVPPNYYGVDFRRGAAIGEFYLIVWYTPYKEVFKLYHTFDYGNTLTYQGEHLCNWDTQVALTGGRKPGSFYVARRALYEPYLYIDYSMDYGVTYTTFTHLMDSTFTNIPKLPPPVTCKLYPTPTSKRLNIDVSGDFHGGRIEISNLFGQRCLINKLSLGTDHNVFDVSMLSSGIYLVSITSGSGRQTREKVIIENNK